MSTNHHEEPTLRPGPELLQNEKVEELKQQGDIQKALQQTSGAAPVSRPQVEKKTKMFLVTYLVSLLLLAGAYYVLRVGSVPLGPALRAFLQRMDLGAMAIATVIVLMKSIDVFLIDRVDNSAAKYNIRRVLK